MSTLQSGSALFMRSIDAATNAAWRTGMRDLAARLALRYGAACSMPQRKCCGAREPSQRIDRGHELPAAETPLKPGASGRCGRRVLSAEADEPCMTYKRRIDLWRRNAS